MNPPRTLLRLEHMRVLLMILAAALLAVMAGLAVANEAGTLGLVLAGAAGIGLLLWAVQAPRVLFWIAVTQVIFFPALQITSTGGVNLMDFLIPPALLGTWLWYRPWVAGTASALRSERTIRGVTRGAIAFYAIALLSLLGMVVRGHPGDALNSLLVLSRSVEGAMFFYLTTRLVRTRRDLEGVRNAIVTGFMVAFLANFIAVVVSGIPRAGAVWVIGEPGRRAAASWNLGGLGIYATNPNELAAGCLLVWVLVLAIPYRRFVTILVLAMATWLLLASQSRSGLMAWLVFLVIYGWRGRKRWLWLLPIGLAAVLPILPHDLRDRLLRTLIQQRGSFEAYTSLIRIYCFQSAFAVFQAYPILGVGYVGFRFVSQSFNPLGAVLVTAENFFLETAAGMGVLGLGALAFLSIAIYRMGRVARRTCPPGTAGYALGTMTSAYLLALATSSLTVDNLTGLMCVGQLAVFTGLMVQSTRIEARDSV